MKVRCQLTQERWITVKEAASQLGVSDETVYRLARNGEIKHRRVLGRVSIAQSAVETILRDAERPGKEQSNG